MEYLRKLKGFLLTILDNRGDNVTAMEPMNTDTDSDLDYNIPEIWQKRLRMDASRKSFFGPLKGKEMSGKPIIEKDDFVNQAGDVICNESHLKNLENCWKIFRAFAPTYGKAQRIRQSADKGAEMNDLEKRIIWLAGLTDGEGTIAVFYNREKSQWCENGVYERLHAIYTIANTDPSIINEAQKVLYEIGVTSQVYKRTPQKPNHSIGMHLNVRKLSHIKIVLEKLHPYLIAKKAQAELTLRFVKSRLNRPDFHVKKKNQSKPFTKEEFDISTQITSLNRKGCSKVSETKRQTPKGEDIVRTAGRPAELATG